MNPMEKATLSSVIPAGRFGVLEIDDNNKVNNLLRSQMTMLTELMPVSLFYHPQ